MDRFSTPSSRWSTNGSAMSALLRIRRRSRVRRWRRRPRSPRAQLPAAPPGRVRSRPPRADQVDSPTSSIVERNASTRWCGRCLADESDGGPPGVRPSARRPRAAHGRVEVARQRVLPQHARARVRRLSSRILAPRWVARDGDGRHLVALALLALDLAAGLHLRDLTAHFRYLLAGSNRSVSILDLTRPWGGGGRRPCRRPSAGTATDSSRAAAAACTASAVVRPRLALSGLGMLVKMSRIRAVPVDDLDLGDVLEGGSAAPASAHRRR